MEAYSETGSIPFLIHYKRLLLNEKTLGFLASGGEEFNLVSVMRLDGSEVLCNKVLLKYKRERENFWHRHQKGGRKSAPLLVFAAAAAKSLKSCPTLCDPIDGSPPGSPIAGILQTRTLEWLAISFSNAWKWKVKVKSLSCVRLLATSWTVAYHAPPSMGFSRQEYWSGVPLSSPAANL